MSRPFTSLLYMGLLALRCSGLRQVEGIHIPGNTAADSLFKSASWHFDSNIQLPARQPVTPMGPSNIFQSTMQRARTGVRFHFASYAIEGFEEGMNDLCSQVRESEIFHEVHCFEQLPDEALDGRWNAVRRKAHVQEEWLYQPALVQYLLRNVIPDGDVLFFAEGSVELNLSQTSSWTSLFELMIGPASAHLVAFQRSDIAEYENTKADVFREFGVWMDDVEVQSYGITASYFMVKNVRPVRLFMNNWAYLIAQPKLLSDTSSHAPNHDEFLEHHHTESLWSMMVKANRKNSKCKKTYSVKELRIRILPYKGCDDLREVKFSPLQAHCERHRKGLKNRLRRHMSEEVRS